MRGLTSSEPEAGAVTVTFVEPDRGEPKEVVAKYPGTCAECLQPFAPGEMIYWWPRGRTVPSRSVCVNCRD